MRCPEFANFFEEVYMKQIFILIRLALIVLLFVPCTGFAGTDGAIQLNKEPRGAITLKKAVALALLNNPQLLGILFAEKCLVRI